MRRSGLAVALSALLLAAGTVIAPSPAQAAHAPHPADPLAGGSATALHRNLINAQQPGQLDGFLVGQQHANWDSKRYRTVDAELLEWRGPRIEPGGFDGFVSDIELATTLLPGVEARSPAVYGFNLQMALKLEGSARLAYADRVVDAYASGGVVTIHFPSNNPVSGGGNKDVSANALCMLSVDWDAPPGVAAAGVAQWQAELTEAASFFRLVNTRWRDPDADGVAERSGRVAMVFRPFHEMLRIRHWWSADFYHEVPGVCEGTPAEAFRSLWRQTFDYLVGPDELDVHGLLFAWAPDRPTAYAGWEAFYPNTGLEPGSSADYVDVVAFDVYESTAETFSAQLVSDAAAMVAFNAALPPAEREIVAIGEFGPRLGLSTVAQGNWFLEAVLRPLAAAGLLDDIAYAMTWSNLDEDRYWVPLPCFNVDGCETHDGHGLYETPGRSGDPTRGFRAFVNHPSTVFLEDLPEWWRAPDPTIPFQPGESPDPLLSVPCFTGYHVIRPDGQQRMDACPVQWLVGRPMTRWR